MTAVLLGWVLLGQVGPPAPPPPIDTVIAKLTEIRSKRAALDKEEAAIVADLQSRGKELLARLAELGVRIDGLPTPPPPPKPDPLGGELQALYAVDGGLNKAQALAALVALYTAAADLACLPANETAEALKQALTNRVKENKVLTPDAGQRPLDALRKRLGAELDAGLKELAGPLNDDSRKKVCDVYARLAKALEGIK